MRPAGEMLHRILVVFSVCVCVATSARGFNQNARVNRDALLVQEFQDGVADYVKLRKQVAAQLSPLKPTDSPEQIDVYQRELAQRIRAARPRATQGHIFSGSVAGEFRRLIALSMRGAEGARVRTSLQRGARVTIPVVVNTSYPSTAPRETTPPSLLLNLPKLPPELEYRVVGDNLVLLDATANLIVDFIPGAIP